MVVPEGLMVEFYKNQDRTGRRSHSFYQGTYNDLSFYGVWQPGVVHIQKTDLTRLDFVEVKWEAWFAQGKTYPMYLQIPVGDRKDGTDFPNDKIEKLSLPFGVNAEVFDEASFRGGSLIFSGTNPNGNTVVNLNEYDYSHKVSSMRVTADAWVSAGIRLENEVFVEGGEWEAETGHVSNNSKSATVTLPLNISTTVEDTTEIQWDIRVGVSAKAEFQFGPEVSQGTVGVEVSVEGGYGENELKTNSRTVDRGLQVEVPPNSVVDGTLMVRHGVMEADIVRVWKNRRTGAFTETRGKVKIQKAGETRIEVNDRK